ncbi:hypothetical protein diail_3838 [Diaporthe ilicicola]|nr:hypothetical protein diail_3838 [Diaporthe ilicicola]
MVSTTANPDSELFCSVSSTQKVPERHPSTLIPGGHTSPLRHPTVLRPGAGNHHGRKPSSEAARSPGQHQQRNSSPTPKPTYKAYSPPATPKDPRASVVADEIESYFTALDMQPLHIKKQDTIASPSSESSGATSPVQRCASPPLPPKVKIGEQQPPSPPAENSSASQPETHAQVAELGSEEPPAYEESERVEPPPEKPATTESQEAEKKPASSNSLAGSAAMSAAQVGGSVAGVDTNQAVAENTTEEDSQQSSEEDTAEETTQGEDASKTGTTTVLPPPLPPRPAPTSTTPQPDTAAQMPGAFPPPPRRSPSPKGTSSGPKMNYVPGAAATSATAVGAAVAIPSTDFAHGGLAHARRALGQRVSHLIDRAKEHHEAKRGSATRGSGLEEGRDRGVFVVAPIAGH